MASAVLQLKDIHMPSAPGAWPPAPGWWLLVIVVVALLFWTARWFFRYLKRRKLQRMVIAELERLQRPADSEQLPQWLADISILLRRVAMMQYPRKEVADLAGEKWTAFLDRHGGNGQYTKGVGRVLVDGPYARCGDIDEVDIDALLALVKEWVRHNIGKTERKAYVSRS
jgi:hypothetical protein